MKLLPLPEKAHLDACFVYSDGALFWRHRPLAHFKSLRVANMWNAKFAGKRAGREMVGMAYRQVGLDNVRYLEHRIIAAMHGICLAQHIDHRDRCGLNNAPSNLRPCTQTQNSYNSSGWAKKDLPRGVISHNGKWRAHIKADGVKHHLGTFESANAAIEARLSAEARLFGEFAPARSGISK